MNRQWESFLKGVPWFLQPGDVTNVGATEPPGLWTATSNDFKRLFPALHRLLQDARRTAVEVNGTRYLLFSWKYLEGEDCAWLSPLPSKEASVSLHPHHRVLLSSFGGIVERSNEPATWLLNQNAVLTEIEAQNDASFISDYKWAFDDAGLAIPIGLAEFYSIAKEANGNTTLCHRRTGEILLFAPDHAFNHIVPAAGCPEYTLYRIPEAPLFSAWVEAVAVQWSKGICP